MIQYPVILFIFMMFSMASGIASAHKIESGIIKYTLNFQFDKDHQEIVSSFCNKMPIELHIREDASPLSFLLRGAQFSVFEDTVELKRIPIMYNLGEKRLQYFGIPADECIEERKKIWYMFGEKYCGILKRNSVLIFWKYSSESDGYSLLPSDGVFRISQNDVKC